MFGLLNEIKSPNTSFISQFHRLACDLNVVSKDTRSGNFTGVSFQLNEVPPQLVW